MTLDDWLEAQRINGGPHGFEVIGKQRMQQVWDAAIASLRGEPVAWRCQYIKDGRHIYLERDPLLADNCPWETIMPLYAHPPAAQWVSVQANLSAGEMMSAKYLYKKGVGGNWWRLELPPLPTAPGGES